MPLIIALYLYFRIVRRVFDIDNDNHNDNNPIFERNKTSHVYWDKLTNHPFNEYEW